MCRTKCVKHTIVRLLSCDEDAAGRTKKPFGVLFSVHFYRYNSSLMKEIYAVRYRCVRTRVFLCTRTKAARMATHCSDIHIFFVR